MTECRLMRGGGGLGVAKASFVHHKNAKYAALPRISALGRAATVMARCPSQGEEPRTIAQSRFAIWTNPKHDMAVLGTREADGCHLDLQDRCSTVRSALSGRALSGPFI